MGLRGDVRVRQPAKDDLVGRRFVVAGLGSGFEGTIVVRVLQGSRVVGETSAQSSGGRRGDRRVRRRGRARPLPPSGHPADRRGRRRLGRRPADHPAARRGDLLPAAHRLAVWRVERGDTLSRIVREVADLGRTTVAQVVAANPAVSDPDVIRPGQLLRVPLS